MKEWLSSKTGRAVVTVLFFTAVFWIVVVRDLHGLGRMPGDLGDSRLNNIFLENVWQVLIGRSDSFVHLPFYWPFPFVVGFSDNLWGSAPIYVGWRLVGCDPMTAFQLWFYVGFALNFFAMHWVLRRLGFSLVASLTASMLYAFCLPGLVQAGHVQLQYRCAVPLAVYFFVQWLQKAEVTDLVNAMLWTVWQFWLGMYMGIFLLLFLLALAVVDVFQRARGGRWAEWRLLAWQSVKNRPVFAVVCVGVALVFMGLLFYPYVAVSWIYGTHRGWREIASMLPRLRSYFLMDNSSVYGALTTLIAPRMPMRWEHQLFIGFVPTALLVAGLYTLKERGATKEIVNVETTNFLKLSAWALLLVFLVTLSVSGRSFWWFFSKVPLFNATRAMSRVILLMVFPASLLAAVGMEFVRKQKRTGFWLAQGLIVLAALELSAGGCSSTAKADWVKRETMVEARLANTTLDAKSILFLAQTPSEPEYMTELDAMWAAQKAGAKTMNGYTGFVPNGCSGRYNSSAGEAQARFMAGCDAVDRSGQAKDFVALQLRCVGFDGECSTIDGMKDSMVVVPGYVERFDAQSSHKVVLLNGFAVREDWGVWTKRETAALMFYVGRLAPQRLRFTFRAYGDATHSQRLKFAVNDRVVLEKTFPTGMATVELPLPVADVVKISLNCPDAVSPRSLGENEDRRKLSVGLVSAEFLK